MYTKYTKKFQTQFVNIINEFVWQFNPRGPSTKVIRHCTRQYSGSHSSPKNL